MVDRVDLHDCRPFRVVIEFMDLTFIGSHRWSCDTFPDSTA